MAVRSWGVVASLARRWNSSVSSSRVVASHQLRFRRNCSSTSGDETAPEGWIDSNSLGEQIEQALYEFRIQSAAPAWLPFFPGGSFWIHPDQITDEKAEESRNPLLDPASEGEVLAMVMPMGWPTPTAAGDAMSPGSDSAS